MNVAGLVNNLLQETMFECISNEGVLKEGRITFENGDVY